MAGVSWGVRWLPAAGSTEGNISSGFSNLSSMGAVMRDTRQQSSTFTRSALASKMTYEGWRQRPEEPTYDVCLCICVDPGTCARCARLRDDAPPGLSGRLPDK